MAPLSPHRSASKTVHLPIKLAGTQAASQVFCPSHRRAQSVFLPCAVKFGAKMTQLSILCLLIVIVSYGKVAAQMDSKSDGNIEPEAMTPECLQCLCEGASGCKSDIGCKGGVCGPFQITRPYWLDAGKPTVKGDRRGPSSPTAYADCANNIECSKRTVTAYMKRYAQDCNDDKAINCIDYASIHRLGPGSCKNEIDQTYFYKFAECLQRTSQEADANVGPRNEVLARSSIPVNPTNQ